MDAYSVLVNLNNELFLGITSRNTRATGACNDCQPAWPSGNGEMST